LNAERSSQSARVWIDLSTPACVQLFGPVVKELELADVDVVLTARDFSETVELARERFPNIAVVGSWGRGWTSKAAALSARTIALTRFAMGRGFDAAVSQNSYAQVVAAKLLRLPCITTMDYEGQPANHLAFRLADLVIVPEVFPAEALARFGARRVRRYAGLKEEVYLSSNGSWQVLRREIGISGDRDVLIVLRPPPDSSTYHHFENPLFTQTIDRLLSHPETFCLLLPRSAAQAKDARQRWGNRVHLPKRVLSGIDLLLAADLVVGGGGTMNRESALLGTPTYSLFAGAPSAVDAYLVDRGMLTILSDCSQLDQISIRRKSSTAMPANGRQDNGAFDSIVSSIGDLLERA
jgi:uncharacterized protein